MNWIGPIIATRRQDKQYILTVGSTYLATVDIDDLDIDRCYLAFKKNGDAFRFQIYNVYKHGMLAPMFYSNSIKGQEEWTYHSQTMTLI